MESTFNQDITVINQYFDKTEKKIKYKVSYIKGFWSSNNGISINGTQLTKVDGLSARILMNDSRNETYQKTEDFVKEQLTWTLQTDDYLVKGIVKDFTTITKLVEDYRDVIKIKDIATKDYGSKDMWHFAITGV